MRRAERISGSTLGQTVSIRFSQALFPSLRRHLLGDGHNEQFAFGLFNTAKTADGTTLLVNDMVFPDKKDLGHQSGGGVSPTKEFQATVYLVAQQRGMGILDVHTHPFQDVPQFSGIDEAESAKNARYISRRFPASVTHAMIVFGRDIRWYDAAVFDRSLDAYRTAALIEVLGRGMEIMVHSAPEATRDVSEECYARQVIIPGWNQAAIARQRIAVVGAGGNGAQMIETLASIGMGTAGWIAAIDPDVVEASNRPRIPYAFPEHVGSPKVTVAAQYVGRKNPAVRFYPYPCSVTESAATARIKGATIIVGAGDRDGVRKFCNELSVRHLIPYVDLGCDIQVRGQKVEAGGQVRVVLPGQNACLVCCGGFDPSAASTELMDDARAATHAAHGYVRGVREQATPSVTNLNATTAQLGVSAILALIHGNKFGNWDYAHYDQLTCRTLVASTKRKDDCPLCGLQGILGAGDERIQEAVVEPAWSGTGDER